MRLNFCFRLYEEWAKNRKKGKTKADYGDIGSVEDEEEKHSNSYKNRNKNWKKNSRSNDYKRYHRKYRTYGHKKNINQVCDPYFHSPPGYIQNNNESYNLSHNQRNPNYSQNSNQNRNRNYKQKYNQDRNQQYFNNWDTNNFAYNQQRNNHGQYGYQLNTYQTNYNNNPCDNYRQNSKNVSQSVNFPRWTWFIACVAVFIFRSDFVGRWNFKSIHGVLSWFRFS